MRTTRVSAFALILTVILLQDCQTAALESGVRIRVGSGDAQGPLAAHAVISHPVGVASVSGADQPDLFVRTGRFGSELGLFLHPWIATAKDGTPVFGNRIRIKIPIEREVRDGEYSSPCSVFQTPDGVVHGVWLDRDSLVHALFDVKIRSFKIANRVRIKKLPRDPASVAVMMNPDGSVEVLLGIGDGVVMRPTDFHHRDPRYRPYDGTGVWRGGFPYVGLYASKLPDLLQEPASPPRLVSRTQREVRNKYAQITLVNLGPGRGRDVITGSHYGGLHDYHNTMSDGLALERRVHVVDATGTAHRHPTVGACPVAYPNPETRLSDLIVGGEGALYYYRFTGELTDEDKPIYDAPRFVLEQNADLYGGTLPVPNVVDWDGDGKKDIVSGNSEGKILFFRNTGTRKAPAFAPGVPLEAGGRVIYIQPGYRDNVQGPDEARWGYACPTVADWNGDGLPDILMNDSTAKHTVYLNGGAPDRPELAEGHPLYFDGLDMHGTWRVKPAVAKIENRMAYVALDDQDQFHLYWRVDNHNLEDGGELHRDDGSVIGANFLSAGGTGRLKLNLVDWDIDGLLDLLVGTPRHGSIPNPETGLPQSLGLPGSAVLFLRNVGSNSEPVFEFPKLMAFRGDPIFLGQHACGPAVADFGREAGPDLIVGEEDGRFWFYRREDLSLKTVPVE